MNFMILDEPLPVACPKKFPCYYSAPKKQDIDEKCLFIGFCPLELV